MASIAIEVWKPIYGYTGFYEVSNLGRIKRLSRRIKHKDGKVVSLKERINKINTVKNKRRIVSLWKNGKKKSFTISSLVLRAFVGPRPKGFHCCHNNGKLYDDRLDNLRYDTPRGNSLIADKFNIAASTVGNIVRYEIWNVDDEGNPIHPNYRKDKLNFRSKKAKKLKAFGKIMTIKQWAEETGIPEFTIRSRIRRGWAVRRVLSE